ncbi:MAG: HlyD family efflux transporter periplasmic adaptor subunit [Candidatus Omnitrophica bacterium]|nr:HlyD family efflux transporter periplasmic adaptor subunit [Candidatus Omnitrophota bacterium]
MHALRLILTWVVRHRFWSAAIGIIVIAGVWWVGRIQTQSAGILSEPLQTGTIVESVYGIGTVTASHSYQLRPGLISTVSELYVKEGDTVKKDDPLIKIDSRVFQAPFDGTVTFLPFKVGENIYPQGSALSLVDLRERYLVVSLEQQGALQVQAGQKVRISLDTIRGQNYDGRVESVYSNNSNFLARIIVSGLPFSILPDMTGDVAIQIRAHENALIAPVAALERGRYLWRKRGPGIPKRVEVTAGIMDKEQAEITSGDLQAGDRVLIRKDLNK